MVLSPAAYGQECEAAALAHELFHFWCRSAVDVDLWSNLTCLTPSVLRRGSIEEIVVERLTRTLCEQLELEYEDPQPIEVPRDLLARRARLARAAVSVALDNPRDPQRLIRARDALRLLSGFELAALALLAAPSGVDARLNRFLSGTSATGSAQAPGKNPPTEELDAIGPRHEGPPAEAYASELPDLSGPQLLKALCKLFVKRRWNDHRRGPLWAGDNPLEVPPRVLHTHARTQTSELSAFLEACRP